MNWYSYVYMYIISNEDLKKYIYIHHMTFHNARSPYLGHIGKSRLNIYIPFREIESFIKIKDQFSL